MVDSLLGGKKGKTATTRSTGRLARSILLGTLAVGFAIYWLADSYGADPDELLAYLKASLLFVALFATTGVIAALLLSGLRRLRKRRAGGNQSEAP